MKDFRKRRSEDPNAHEDIPAEWARANPGTAEAQSETEELVESEDATPVEVETPRVEEDGLGRQLEEQRDKYLRLAAEYDNYRRRSLKEKQELTSRAQADLVKQMVDALDDLSRFSHLDATTTDASTVIQGVDMVEKKLLKMLGNAGLEVIDPVGEPFDPAKHEALATEPATGAEEDQLVARVYQRGYMFGSQLLRPARVVVKQWTP
jgi:molecular chaperone GrpE